MRPRTTLPIILACVFMIAADGLAQWGRSKAVLKPPQDPEDRKLAAAAVPQDADAAPADAGQVAALITQNPAYPPSRAAETEEDTAPPSILHEPVKNVLRGQTLVVSANIIDRSGVETATLFFRPMSEGRFRAVSMEKGLDGIYRAIIPSEFTDCDSVSYYFEATDRKLNGPSRLGNPRAPQTVFLDRPPKPATGMSRAVGLVSILTSAIVAGFCFVSIRGRLQRSRALDALFWAKILIPYLHLPAEQITQRVTELSRSPLLHPVQGETVYPRVVILKKLDMVRRLNLNRLLEQSDRYVRQYMDLL